MTTTDLIPEWPQVNGSRPAMIGIKGGADHPFGALLIVMTPDGLVVVAEYLERQQANIRHKHAITKQFGTAKFADLKWAVRSTEDELITEFALAGVPMLGVPNTMGSGVQRVQSWLDAKQLFIVASTCPETVRQLRRYRFAENTLPDGQKRLSENVFRADNELPEALAVAVLAWPELPKVTPATMTERERKRWEGMDDRTRQDIQRVKDYESEALRRDLGEDDPSFPVGDFFGSRSKSW